MTTYLQHLIKLNINMIMEFSKEIYYLFKISRCHWTFISSMGSFKVENRKRTWNQSEKYFWQYLFSLILQNEFLVRVWIKYCYLLLCLGPLCLLANNEYKIIWLSNILALRLPNEGYSSNALCALNLISTFLLQHD